MKNDIFQKDVKRVWITNDSVCVDLKSGEVGTLLFSDFERLASATKKERNNFELSPSGIHWEAIDEDISFNGFF